MSENKGEASPPAILSVSDRASEEGQYKRRVMVADQRALKTEMSERQLSSVLAIIADMKKSVSSVVGGVADGDVVEIASTAYTKALQDLTAAAVVALGSVRVLAPVYREAARKVEAMTDQERYDWYCDNY